MAVPFNVNQEDENIIQTLTTLRRCLELLLQQSLARRATPSSRSRGPTAGANSSTASTSRRTATPRNDTRNTPPNNSLPDLVNDLAVLTAEATAITTTASTSQQLNIIPVERSQRRRTSSESSCCEETKISITAIVNTGHHQDWAQVGVTLRKIADEFHTASSMKNDGSRESPTLFSKLVPDTLTGSLWTAMICFVGWHLFRAR